LELDSTSWKEQKRRKEVIKHNPVTGLGHPADWIPRTPSVTAPLGGELQNSNQEGSSRLDGDPGDWINCPESGRNSRLQEFKNPVDWMVIQATGLINPNQAESPGGILMKIQSTG
jgi:hypothetical protein